MDYPTPLHHDRLDEDLQIVQATLTAITNDVHGFSAPAAELVREAIDRLEHARREFSR